MKTIKYGILGTHYIATVMAQAIHESSCGELYAIGSRAQERALDFAKKYNIPHAYGSHQAIIDDPKIDVVYIATPNDLHVEAMIKCIEVGKHILCEKPFTLNVQQANRALDALLRSNVFCMEAQMYRCHPLTQKLVDLVKNKTVGDIVAANAIFADAISTFSNQQAGGSIIDLGCYPLSLIRLLMGAQENKPYLNPTEIKGTTNLHKDKNTDARTGATLKFGNGAIATILVSDAIGLVSDFTLFGTKGSIKVANPWLAKKDKNEIIITTYGNNTPDIINVSSDFSLYATQINVVNHHINQGDQQATTPAMTWDDTLSNMIALDVWRKNIGLHYDIQRSPLEVNAT